MEERQFIYTGHRKVCSLSSKTERYNNNTDVQKQKLLTVPAIHNISTFFLFFVTTFWPRVSSNSFMSVCVWKHGRPVHRKNRTHWVFLLCPVKIMVYVVYKNRFRTKQPTTTFSLIKIQAVWEYSSFITKRKNLLFTYILVAPFHLMICNRLLTSQSSSGLFSLVGKYLQT